MIDFAALCMVQLVKEGYRADRVEYKCIQPPVTRDLFHCIDVLGLRVQPDLLDTAAPLVALIQVTSRSNVSSRKKKVWEHSRGLRQPWIALEVWGYLGTELKRRERLLGDDWVKLL